MMKFKNKLMLVAFIISLNSIVFGSGVNIQEPIRLPDGDVLASIYFFGQAKIKLNKIY